MLVGDSVEVRVTSLSFDQAFDRLRSAIDARGLRLFDVIDHQIAAREVGLDLRPTRVLVFGSPAAGTPLMIQWPLLALELPLRIVIWEGEDHRARLGYFNAGALIVPFQLDPAKVEPLSAPAAIVNDAFGDD